jgi:hypothetical protein
MSDPHAPTSTDIHAGTPHGHGSAPALPFSEADWHEFHQSDKGAGGAVIVLMGGIFSIGLVLYTIVAIIVAQ